jgi:hypothetical protein
LSYVGNAECRRSYGPLARGEAVAADGSARYRVSCHAGQFVEDGTTEPVHFVDRR